MEVNNRGRVCGSSVMKEYPWISKLIMCCNISNVPNFDVTDTLLYMQCLTGQGFTQTKLDMKLQWPKTYLTHLADPISEKYDLWRPYMLKWMVAGLRTYYQNMWHVVEIVKRLLGARLYCQDNSL